MAIADRIHHLEIELAHQREVVTETLARIRGLEAELAALREATEPAPPITGLALTDAIVAVVRNSPTAMRPVEVAATLNSNGTTTDLKTVASTMYYLTTQGRLTKTGRGSYIAV